MEALQQADIAYKIDQGTGTVLVPVGQVHKARIRLASEGLPRGSAVGFELMEKSQGFGTSQFLETARYQRALEGELSRTIASLRNVKNARVHLAIPRQPSFVRQRKAPSASVMVTLFSGRHLSGEQLAGIVHLVSSSIPELTPPRVAVVDQQGKLLTSADEAGHPGLSDRQFNYARRIEEQYVKRVEHILTPLVGYGKVRAQVVADMDFTVTEQTSETYDPERRQLRSEAVIKEERQGSALALGVPGTLSNQPPEAGTAPEQLPAATPPAEDTSAQAAQSRTPSSKSERATNNYELDKTISHVRFAPGKIQRLSVAVVIDNPESPAPAEGAAAAPAGYSPEQIERFNSLVKQAVGYNEQRGDSVVVVNAPFSAPEAPEPLPDPPLWEQPWLYDLLKQLAAGAVVLLLIFFVLRPTMRNLAGRGGPSEVLPAPEGAEGDSQGAPAQLAAPAAQLVPNYQSEMEVARSMVSNDPQRVAQVVKNWVVDNG